MGQVLFISNLPEFRKFFIPLHPLILETNNKTELMGGFFGTVAKATSCVADLFYGTDYNSHLGTKRGGLATYDAETAQLPVPSTIWKAPISARSLKMNWTSSREIPE